MKAGIKKARWSLIALLFGFLVMAGLTFVHHRGSTLVAQSTPAASTPARLQQSGTPLLASIGGQHTPAAAAVGLYHEPVTARYSYSPPQHATGPSGTPGNAPSGSASSDHTAAPTGGSGAAIRPQDNPPSTATTNPAPQALGNSFAYNGYAPLDCELPAGCGFSGGSGYVSHQPSGTSGGQPITHDSQGSSPPSDGSGPPTGGSTPQANNDSDPPTGNTGGPGTPGNSDPSGPGSTPVASAPELDPATLAGAITLLLGSLMVLRSRRRAARASR